MNFLSCVCVDIMGPKFNASLFGRTWRRRQKNTVYDTERRNKVIAFPQWENIFFLVWSQWRHFSGVYEGPIHYLRLLLRERVAHMASYVFVFICAGLRHPSWAVHLLANKQPQLLHLCVRMKNRYVCVFMHEPVCRCLLLVLFSDLLSRGRVPVQEPWSFPVTG